MKKKRPKLQLSSKKIILLSSIIVALGIFILAVSILFAPDEQSEISRTQPTTENADELSKKEDVGTLEAKNDSDDETTDTSIDTTKTVEGSKFDTHKEDAPILTSQEEIKNADIVLVFDDAGNNIKQLQSFIELPFPVTISVMPQRVYSVESAERIRAAGKEVFLHQPMQSVKQNIDPGKGAILPTMNGAQITQQLKSNIKQIAPIKGMNNHEGSLITSDRYRMGVVLDVCIDEGLIFLDSLTNSESIVSYAAMERDLPVLSRDIFIDNSAVYEDMKAMITKGLAVADKQGYAVMIGHVFNPELAVLLNDMYPILKMQGYKFITASQLYEQLYN